MALYDTVGNIVTDVAVEAGLGAPITDVYASTDANILQMLALLKSTGRGLVLEYPWLQFRKEYTFPTVALTTSYALPEDFQSMVDGTGWNRTARLPLVQLSDAAWQQYKATLVGVVLSILFRPAAAALPPTLELPASPTAGQTIAFDYRSRYWVGPLTDAGPTSDAPAAYTDYIFLDVQLITRALKLAFLRAKGFDISAAQDDFDAALANVQSANVNVAPTLSLNGPRFIDRLLDDQNLPITGYGA